MIDFTEQLSKLTVATLKARLRAAGVHDLSLQRKHELAARLAHRLSSQLEPTAATVPRAIVALDVGYVHLAHATLLLPPAPQSLVGSSARLPSPPPPVLVDWRLHADHLPAEYLRAYDPVVTARRVRRAVDAALDGAAAVLLGEGGGGAGELVLLVERQSWRHGTAAAQPVVRAAAVEAMAVALASQRLEAAAGSAAVDGAVVGAVASVQPRAVAEHFRARGELSAAARGSYTGKKRDAVRLVGQWVERAAVMSAAGGGGDDGGSAEEPLRVAVASPALAGVFKGAQKRDDLSDALLLAVAWADWEAEAARQARQLVSSSDGEVERDEAVDKPKARPRKKKV
ncbi:hypothetical protein HK405_009387 [Cladochytrium tenue]|nr:hypothetical protein HK405_009387 [Cladochytrium tenue]